MEGREKERERERERGRERGREGGGRGERGRGRERLLLLHKCTLSVSAICTYIVYIHEIVQAYVPNVRIHCKSTVLIVHSYTV